MNAVAAPSMSDDIRYIENDPTVEIASRLEDCRQAFNKEGVTEEEIDALSEPYHALMDELRDQRSCSFPGLRAKLNRGVQCAPSGDSELDELVVSLLADLEAMTGMGGGSELLVRLGEGLQIAVEQCEYSSGETCLLAIDRIDRLRDTILSQRAESLAGAAVQLRCLGNYKNTLDDGDPSGETSKPFATALFSVTAVVERLLGISRETWGGAYFLPPWADLGARLQDEHAKELAAIGRPESPVQHRPTAVDQARRAVAAIETAGARRHAETVARTLQKSLPELVSEWLALFEDANAAEQKSRAAAAVVEKAGFSLYDEATQTRADWKRWNALAEKREELGEPEYNHARLITSAPTRSTEDLIAKLQFVRAHIDTEHKEPFLWPHEANALDEIVGSLLSGALSVTGAAGSVVQPVSAVAAE